MFRIGSTSLHTGYSDVLNTTTIPGCLSFKHMNTPLPHCYMDDNNDEFIPMPKIVGHNFKLSDYHQSNSKNVMSAQDLKKSLNALSTIPSSR